MKSYRFALLLLALTLLLGPKPTFAAMDEYDDSQSHPLRILAYLVHPAAFLLEWTVLRPFHYFVSATEAQEAFFGHDPHPPVLSEPLPIRNYGIAKKVVTSQPSAKALQPATPAAAPAAAPQPIEKVKIVEVPVEKIVVKEVPKIVEVEKFVFPAVAFRFDSAELTELGKGQVYLAAQRLKEKAELTVLIEGHTDSLGSDDYNQKLGLRRAQAVMKELAGLGIDPKRISAASLGEAKPTINQETEWAHAVNRRVEFHVSPR